MSTLKEYFKTELNRLLLVPVVVVFTKFDLVVSKVLSGIAGVDSRSHESAKATAHKMSEERCRTFLRGNPADLPFEMVSSKLCFARMRQNNLTPLSVSSGSKVWRSHQQIGCENESGLDYSFTQQPCIAQITKAIMDVACATCVVIVAESKS